VFCGNSFGDILRAKGVTNAISAPIGFAVDVALDPINWITAGTAALVPRIFKGVSKAGLAGGKAAVESKAFNAADWGLKKLSRTWQRYGSAELAPENVPSWMKWLAVKGERSKYDYDNLVYEGQDFLAKKASERVTSIDNMVMKTKDAAGKSSLGNRVDALIDGFVMDADEFAKDKLAIERAYGKESAARAVGSENPMATAQFSARSADDLSRRRFEASLSVTKDMEENPRAYFPKGPESYRQARAHEVSNLVNDRTAVVTEAERVVAARKAAEAAEIAEEEAVRGHAMASREMSLGSEVRKGALEEMPREEIDDMYSLFRQFSTGASGYDRAVVKLIGMPKFRKVIRGYNRLMTVFKTSAVFTNPVSHVNQHLEGLASGAAAGIDILDKGFRDMYRRSLRLVFREDFSELKEIYGKSVKDFIPKDWPTPAQFADEVPQSWTEVMGINAGLVTDGEKYVDALQRQLSAVQSTSNRRIADTIRETKESLDGLKRAMFSDFKSGKVASAAERRSLKRGLTSTVTPISDLKGGRKGTEVGTSYMFTADYGKNTDTRRWINELEKKINGPNPKLSDKLLHQFLTRPVDFFGRNDSSLKTAYFGHLTRNGLDESSFRRLSNWLSLEDGKDFVRGGPTGKYFLHPEAAFRAANEIMKNYGAIGSLGNILRRAPIVGSPFAAFSLVSARYYAKVLRYNPSYFTAVNYMMREISGQRTPLEKESLESKYYSYLDRDGMMKLPFFRENPMYVNLSSAFPHFSFNFLQPSERSYGDRFGDEVAKLIDEGPLFKDPFGQFLMDYAIMPTLISEEIDRNSMGIPLYPEGSGVAEKAGLAASSLASSFTPKVAGLVGLVPSPLPESIEEDITPYNPLGFLFRKLRNATKGRTPSGMPASESAGSRTFRGLFSQIGAPTYRMNLDFAASQAKKKEKEK
jgi:hypothetical protein